MEPDDQAAVEDDLVRWRAAEARSRLVAASAPSRRLARAACVTTVPSPVTAPAAPAHALSLPQAPPRPPLATSEPPCDPAVLTKCQVLSWALHRALS